MIWIFILLIDFSFSSAAINTFVFSGGSNTYIAFDSWRPCLTGYVRFDVRTTAQDGTLAYIDDRGKFDFFYLKLIEGKPRLLFNLGNDRQALNVNMKINDDQWHTIYIKRHGQRTILSIDHGRVQNATITHSEDLYFGGAMSNEYQASPFYFGGNDSIPSILERPSSGNLSSFDVYMQARFRGQLRNVLYKNCTNPHLIQPIPTEMSGGISLIPNYHCSGKICGVGKCLITDTNYQCLCDETDTQGKNCQVERETNELTFHGKHYSKYTFNPSITSSNEIFTFEFKTNHYNGLLFQFLDSQIYMKLKQGQLSLEYRMNQSWHEFVTKDLDLIDNQWHFVQMKRQSGQITLLIDQHSLQLDNDIHVDRLYNFTQILIGGTRDSNTEKFYGCIKDISIIFNENFTLAFNQSARNLHHYGPKNTQNCRALLNPIQFLSSSSYISLDLWNTSLSTNISFRFETYSSNCILLYSQSNEHFLGLDLIDGFLYITLNTDRQRQRQELFQQRLNNGQTHTIQLQFRVYQDHFEFNGTMDYRQNTKTIIRTPLTSKFNLRTLTIGSVNPSISRFPTNYISGLMHRGFIGCFSDLEINNQLINLTNYINHTSNDLRSGPCSTTLSRKRECLCEHGGECRLNHGETWSCDCSKTGYTGSRCEQMAYHLDLSEIPRLELNTNLQWSELLTDVTFGLQARHDEEKFLEIRSCRLSSKCDAISFSIRNGLLQIHSYLFNLTSEYPFLLDNQWHVIHLQHIERNFLLHVDNHITQQRLNQLPKLSAMSSTVWLIFQDHKQVRIEDLRVSDRSIYPRFFLQRQQEHVQLKSRAWKPSNAISFDREQNSSLEIQLTEILCQECHLDSIYFQFRTTELDGVLLFAEVQINRSSISTFSDNAGTVQYLLLKLVQGRLHLLILDSSSSESADRNPQIQTKVSLNDGHWHHISFHRASDYHFELIVDEHTHSLSSSIYFLDRIYFGRPSHLKTMSTLKSCLASVTINSHMINLREYIKSNSPIRNDCFLDSQCPLKHCQNTGICLDRIRCDCQHTSFQGRFCTQLRGGYAFNNYTPGLIFDQPFLKEKPLSIYKLSFAIVTKQTTAELIRINDQISIELHRGSIRIRLLRNEWIHNEQLVNDGLYHLVRMTYNISGYVRLNVDKKSVRKQVPHRMGFDKALLLFIGQNPTFEQPFQGQLYGLESDIYSIFDLISPTFQRISFAPLRNKSQPLLSAILYAPSSTQDPPTCSQQSYDDICIVTSDTNSTPFAYPILSAAQSSFSSRIPIRLPAKSLPGSTLSSQLINSSHRSPDMPPLNVSVRTPDGNRVTDKFRWHNIWILTALALCGILLCIVLSTCALIKYRRKDAGVYELEETQRFRPLIVELPPSPGESMEEVSHATVDTPKKSQKRRKHQKSLLRNTDEQREFYI